jgi:aspartyl-tRNA(Asn)/glutamyl-tRNA(Gln) amidotransferase subunit C
MKINIPHIAKLASLTISKSDEEKFEKQLSAILEHIQNLQMVDTSKIDETAQVTGLENVLREDVASQSLSATEALSNAKKTHNDLFQVEGILEE